MSMIMGGNGSTPVRPSVPGVYDDSLSLYQKLNRLKEVVVYLLNREAQWVSLTDFNAYKQFITSDQSQQTIDLQTYTDKQIAALRMEMTLLIDEIIVGQIRVWNPTNGTYDTVDETVSHVYAASTEYAITAATHDALNLTVAQWDALGMTAHQYDTRALETLYPNGNYPRSWEVANGSRIV